jgi:phenylacetate-CoA ligase
MLFVTRPAAWAGPRRQDLMTNIAVHIARGQVIPDFKRYVIEHLLRPARLATVTQKPGFYPSGSTFAYLAGLRQFGMRLLLQSVFAPIEEQVARLNDFRPEHLTGYTSALEALAREEIAGRLRLRSGGLQQVTNIAEPLPPDSRAFIEGAFGVHISDCYSAAECLAMTSGCPHFAGSHVNLDLARVEIVDDRYRPVPDGEAGARLLVTNLYNTVVPLIRYELGDAATMSRSPCPCGSPLPLVQSVAGRTKERFWAEIDGRVRELPYYLFLAGLHHYLDLAEHQVVQTGWNRFTVRVAPVRNKTLSADRVRNLVADSLRAEGLLDVIDFSVEILDTIAPDAQTGKIRRAVNLFGSPPSEPEHRQPRQKEGPLEPLKGRS